MRVKVQCHCGWRRELSGFYAGKRIRCADCQAVLEVPGDSDDGAYLYPPMRNWPSGRHVRPRGEWVPVMQVCQHRRWQREKVRRRCAVVYHPKVQALLGMAGFVLLFAVIITIGSNLPRIEAAVEKQFPGKQPQEHTPQKEAAPPAPQDESPGPVQPDDDFETEQVDEF